MPKRIVQLSLLAAAVGLFATGCSAPQDPAAENSGEKEPIVVVDQNGEEQQLPGSIDRFVTTRCRFPACTPLRASRLTSWSECTPVQRAHQRFRDGRYVPDLLDVPSSFVQATRSTSKSCLPSSPMP